MIATHFAWIGGVFAAGLLGAAAIASAADNWRKLSDAAINRHFRPKQLAAFFVEEPA